MTAAIFAGVFDSSYTTALLKEAPYCIFFINPRLHTTLKIHNVSFYKRNAHYRSIYFKFCLTFNKKLILEFSPHYDNAK